MSASGAVTTNPPVAGQVAEVEVATPTEDLVTVIFGTCLMLGAMSDGWAHNNILSDVQAEGFFTIWHGLLYSGFAASAAWTFWLAYRRRERHPRWWVDGWPAGYKAGALGVLLFLAAGVADMAWHTTFGIETSIDALLSPSHLLLCAGSVLLLSSPMRSWWATGEGGRRAATGVASMALATTSISVFLLYASAFDYVSPVLPYDGTQASPGYTAASRGVASYVVTTALLVVPLLLAHRRRTTPGVATALVAAVGLFPMGTNEFPRPHATAVFAAIAGAVLVDWILVWLDRTRGFDARGRLPIAGAVFGGLVSAAHLLGLHLDAGILWPVELWTGAVVTSAAVGALLGTLAAGVREPARPVVAR